MKSLLICIAKDEDLYLEEWLKYHLKLGFTNIAVIQNNWQFNQQKQFTDKVIFISDDFDYNSYDLESKYPIRDKAPSNFQKYYYRPAQTIAYNRYIDKYINDYDFIACFDIDEFLWLQCNNLNDFLKKYETKQLLFIRWRMFGDSGLTQLPIDGDYSVLKRFQRCGRNLESNGKTIINVKINKGMFHMCSPHTACDMKGHRINQCIPIDAEIFHFRNKTRQERMLRISGQDRFDSLYEKCNKNDVINTKAFDFYNS